MVWMASMGEHETDYDVNGDLIGNKKMRFRQVGWQINGGINDGTIFPEDAENAAKYFKIPHGSVSPVYVQIGTD